MRILFISKKYIIKKNLDIDFNKNFLEKQIKNYRELLLAVKII